MTSGDPARLLVVDDQDANRFIKVQILRRAGYAVTEAQTGSDAVAEARRARPDLVVLDVNLPDISGLEVCRTLKQLGSPTIQVLQVSQTAVTETDRARGLDEGADMYLIEPFGAQVLLSTVRALLRVRTAELDLEQALDREREAREEAQRANRMKDEFLAMVSHELRTPLNAMTGWIWQLRRGLLDEDGHQRAFDVLDRNARVLIQLINDLLDVSRIATGKLQMSLQPIDIRPVVTAASEAVLDSPAHKRKNITLTVEAQSARILGDPARLQQVVTNVLNNAFQFTPAGGTIAVTCGPEDGRAVIRVRDSGAGIDPAFLPHVFERFRQARAFGAMRDRGLGLGLAIVNELVERHGGRVSLDSEGLGRGTTCTITIPLQGAAVQPPSAPASPPPASLLGVRVLLVEDDPDASELLQKVLGQYGAEIVTADSGESALEHAALARFDVLVSDVGLPDFSGLDLLGRLRARRETMPAVAVSAFATDDDLRRILAGGFQAHVAKPVDPDRLVRAVLEAVSAKTPQT